MREAGDDVRMCCFRGVDCSVAPSGSMIVMGVEVTLLLRTGAPCAMKWLVAPVSLIAVVWPCDAVGSVVGLSVALMLSSSSLKPVKMLN